jgi:hypothetical protein
MDFGHPPLRADMRASAGSNFEQTWSLRMVRIEKSVRSFVISRFLTRRHPGFCEPVEQAQFWRTVDTDTE